MADTIPHGQPRPAHHPASAREPVQHHPLRVYFVVWAWLFVLSAASYTVDVIGLEGTAKWSLIVLFMLLKAGLIVAVFMHVVWERLGLTLAILLPPVVLFVFVAIMAFEADYTNLTRLAFFD